MSPRTTQFNLTLDRELVEQLRLVADVEGVSLRELAEEAFRASIDKRRRNRDWTDKLDRWQQERAAVIDSLRT